jgi:hypothetical protein
MVEEDFQPRIVGIHEILTGIANVPKLKGYIATSEKQQAEVPIVSPEEHPILAAWRYGLGRSIAFTSDAKPRWAVEWIKWDKFGKFWTQAVNWLLIEQAEDYDVTVSLTQGKALVVLETFNKSFAKTNFSPKAEGVGERSEPTTPLPPFSPLIPLTKGGRGLWGVRGLSKGDESVGEPFASLKGKLREHFENQIEFNGRATAPDATVQILDLRQTAPNRYEAVFDVNQTGAYYININKLRNGQIVSQQSTSLVSSYAPEFATINPDIGLLKRLADDSNGIFNPTEKQIGHHSGAPTEIFQSLWGLFTLCAALLFVLELIIRRLQLSKSQLLGFRISDFGFRNANFSFKKKSSIIRNTKEFPEGLARLRQRKSAVFPTLYQRGPGGLSTSAVYEVNCCTHSLLSQSDRGKMKEETDAITQQSVGLKHTAAVASEMPKSEASFTERLLKAKKRASV